MEEEEQRVRWEMDMEHEDGEEELVMERSISSYAFVVDEMGGKEQYVEDLYQEFKIAKDFGAAGGSEISNKASVLAEIDRALGVNKPPAVEYIFVEPYADFGLPFSTYGFSRNPYGHAAVRYTLPNGEQKLMNIVGQPHKEMVNFLDPSDYLYGTCFDNGAEQGGVYNRTMISVRIEELPAEQILQMHEYYDRLKRKEVEKGAKFSLLFSPLYNFLAGWLPMALAERGNCARYTSKGLEEGRIIKNASMWPKSLWVELFEEHGRNNPDNVHVVTYRQVRHAKRAYGADSRSISAVAPFNSMANILYFNLERFANVVVEVPMNSVRAEVRLVEKPARPSWWRHHRFSLTTVTIASALLLMGFFSKRGRPFSPSNAFLTF
jgi:hypothetical protein